MNKSKSIISDGFTIVELLVVIGVIAILSTIALVVYPGVTTRANVTKVAQTAKKAQEGLEIAALDKKLPAISSCLNKTATEKCLTYVASASTTDIMFTQSSIDEIDDYFNLDQVSDLTFFSNSDLIYSATNKFASFSDDTSLKYGFGPAIFYHIGNQKDCANDNAAWYDETKMIFFNFKPTPAQISNNNLNPIHYFPADDKHNLCLIPISTAPTTNSAN